MNTVFKSELKRESKMKAEELRIGNLVSLDEQPIEVGWYIIQEIYLGRNRYKPIPLTEEWLKRFGFEVDKIVTHADGRGETGLCKSFLIMLKSAAGTWYACPYGYPLNPNVTLYVHQLQNLYFSLTGSELEDTSKQVTQNIISHE